MKVLMQGVLQVSKHDLIEGQMNGNLISGEVRLSNAIFKKCVRASSPLTPVGQSLSEYDVLCIFDNAAFDSVGSATPLNNICAQRIL